jgi:transcriptional regulator with XRE-family HTH domain
MELQDIIRIERERCGYTQKELAKLVGVTERTIQNYEHGRAVVARIEHIEALSAVLNVDLSEFIDDMAKIPELTQAEKDELEVKKLVHQMSALFAGGELADDDKEAAVRAVTQAYWESKELNKKYGGRRTRNRSPKDVASKKE